MQLHLFKCSFCQTVYLSRTLALPTLAMKLEGVCAKQRLNSKLTGLQDEASQKGSSKPSDAAQRSLLKLLSEDPTESMCHG